MEIDREVIISKTYGDTWIIQKNKILTWATKNLEIKCKTSRLVEGEKQYKKEIYFINWYHYYIFIVKNKNCWTKYSI